MLVNILVNATNNGNSNDALPSGMEHAQSMQLNYLKRKLDVDNTQHQQEQPINTEDGNNNGGAYQSSPNATGYADGPSGKKPHTEEQPGAAAINAATKPTLSNPFHANHFHDYINSNEIVNNNNNIILVNNNNSQNNDLQFSLLNSVFINDLFTYDTDDSVIVPVAAGIMSPTATFAEVGGGPSVAATFVTPSTVSIEAHFFEEADDGANWQATDLLELDHRYNSTPQTLGVVSTASTSTIITTSDADQLNATTQHAQQASQIKQQALQHFAVPQKQMPRNPQMLPKQQPQPQLHRRQLQEQHPQYATPPPPPPQPSSDNESDLEDQNLSWLLNFKFDELPHLSPDITANHPQQAPASQRSTKRSSNSPATSAHSSEGSRPKSPKTTSSTKAAGKKFVELVKEVTAETDGNESCATENVAEDYSPKTQKKPPFTYTELIEYALEDKGGLTVSGIYQWISDRFSFYKSNDDRWKNSVRHNLSINPHFRKGAKASQGAGHLWTISSGDSAENILAWEHKKQRLELFFKMESLNRERIQEHQQRMQQQKEERMLSQHLMEHQPESGINISSLEQSCQSKNGQCLYNEAAIAAATITQEMLQQSSTSSSSPHTSIMSSCSGNSRELRHGYYELHGFNDLLSDEELRKTAGQILNGIHREVKVQSVNSIIGTYHDVMVDSDYLNPVQDVIVGESDLRNTYHNSTSQYYIAELDPIELQMSHQVEEEVLFTEDFNSNYYGYIAAGNDIAA